MTAEIWEVPAICTKAETLELMHLRGHIGIVTMAGATGPQFDCEVTYLGFVGTWNRETKKSHGCYQFGPVDDSKGKHKRFTTLPGSGVPVLDVVMEESEVNDGI